MSDSVVMHPIGMFRASQQQRYEAPRQSGLVSRTGRIELLPQHNFEAAVQDLEGFDRIWVLYHFHRNPNWKPKVLPPRGGVKRGVFATRSPHRPNPIGLSCLRLISVKGLILEVADPDLLDGTPILDIKPYIEYADSFSGTRQGWVGDLPPAPVYTIEWTEQAEADRQGVLKEGVDLMPLTEARLSLDPFPYPSRRIYAHEDGYYWRCQTWKIFYGVDKETLVVRVQRVLSVDSD